MSLNNPFIKTQFPIPWAELTSKQAKIDIKLALKLFQDQIDSISNLSEDQIDYDTVFTSYDNSFVNIIQCTSYLRHLLSVNDNKELRSVYKELNPEITEFFAKIFHNSQLWSIIKKSSEKIDKSKLTYEQVRFIEQTVLEFKLKGADLSDDKKEEFVQIEIELTKLTESYRSNILDSINDFELFVSDDTELDGLSQSFITQASSLAEKKGHKNEYLFTLNASSIRQIMKYSKSEKLRKKIWEGQCTIGHKGEFDNGPILLQILRLRNRKANLLGFDSYADLVLTNMMALNGDNALHFVDELHDKCYSQFNNENEEIRKYKAKIIGDENTEILPWDRLYYSELLHKEKYDFDSEILRPYFPIEKVINGLFSITSVLYGIEFKSCETFYRSSPSDPSIKGKIEVWNEDVKYFEVFDKKTGSQIGGFFVDLYHRENKRNSSWHQSLHYLYPFNPINLSVLCCDIQKPSNGKPSLLSYSDVAVIFHEFGHLCHSILTKTSTHTFAGTKVARDFVELPSQLLENWVFEGDALNLFASHYETGEKVPKDVFDKMIKSKNYHSAILMMSQLSFAKIDLEIHHHFKMFENLDVDQIDSQFLNDYRFNCSIKQPSLLYNLSHIFDSPAGYASCCYSYMWGRELEADAFTKFKKEGILNEKVGMEFRNKILACGNSKPPEEIFRDFMGRDPDPAALFIREGIET